MSANEPRIKRLLAEELTDSSPEFKTEIANLTAGEMNTLGVSFYIGRDGTRMTYCRARQWFERARLSGSAEACYNLGLIYRDGLGVDISLVEAAKYFEEAVAKGQGDAPKALENLINNPEITSFHLEKLADWYYQSEPQHANPELK